MYKIIIKILMKNSIWYFTTNCALKALAAQVSHNFFDKLKNIRRLKSKKEKSIKKKE